MSQGRSFRRGLWSARVALQISGACGDGLLLAGLIVGIAQNVIASDDSSALPSPSVERERAARDLLLEVDRLQLCYHERFERVSDRLADLITYSRDAVNDPTQGTRVLSMASAGRFAVELSTSRDGQTYIQRITGDRIDTYLERDARHEFVDYGQYGWNHIKQACGD